MSRAIDLAALAGSPVYITHVSCEAALARIKAARSRGNAVHAETCPQYLLLDRIALGGHHGERLICAPPLREEKDRAALFEALLNCDLDVLATDHCPFTTAEKDKHADFTTVPGGLPSIEARMGLAHDLARRLGMGLLRWARVCSTNPARIFGLGRKGEITVGFDADLLVFDLEQELTIEAGESLHENVDWTPYAGMRVRGWPRDVISRGRIVGHEGAFVGQHGAGRFVSRSLASDRAESVC